MGVCAVAWAVEAVIGYRGVTLGASVVAVVLVLELGMIVLFDVTALTHPAQTDVGAWLQPWRSDLLAVDGVGGVLAFGVAAFLGFETAAAFGEEVRSERSVGRATWTCLAFLGPSLADPSGIAPVLLPLLVVAAAVAGGQRARWLRRHDPDAWQRLGRGRPAPLALRDVVVADLEL